MKKFLAAAVFGALAALAVAAPLALAPATAQSVATEQSVTFTVDNMTCALCPVTVKRAMEAVEGVRSVEIDFDAGTATVLFDSATTNPDTIAAASANAGYPARVAG